jgi:hypothetical protein
MKAFFGATAVTLLGLMFVGCQWSTSPVAPQRAMASDNRARPAADEFRAAGDITPIVNAFREALGTLNANAPGSRLSGRREINWDAVPPAFTNTNDFPADFFNQPAVGRARGTVFATPGTGFRTSDNNFADLNPAFGRQFVFFSPIRTFAPVGSNEMTVNFFVPGTDTAASSTGFGVVFSDVDRKGSASIEFFRADGRSLGRYVAPVSPQGVSFVGVVFHDAVVARVEIKSGDAAVSPTAVDISDSVRGRRHGLEDEDDDGDRDRDGRRGTDLVIMDDFIYGEPRLVATTVAMLPPTGGSVPAGSR